MGQGCSHGVGLYLPCPWGCPWEVEFQRDQPLPETEHKKQEQETRAPICLLQMGREARREDGARGGICNGELPGAQSKMTTGVGWAGPLSL